MTQPMTQPGTPTPASSAESAACEAPATRVDAEAVAEAIVEEPAEPAGGDLTVPGTAYPVLGEHKVCFPEPLAIHRQVWRTFNLAGTKLGSQLYWKVKDELKLDDYENPLDLKSDLLRLVGESCQPLLDSAVDLLLEYGVDHVSSRDLWEQLAPRCRNSELAKALDADARAIDQYLEELGEEKMRNKASWSGGGFGLTGAIKGAIQAEVLNAAQDGLSSLGRALTGNTYSGRAERFIRERLESHDYPTLVRQLVRNLCRAWLINDITNILVSKHKIPRLQLNTKEADSRSTNIMDLLERGKYTTDQALQGLCESLASTGNPIPIYCCMARIAPEAVPNLLKIADTEGESLELARRLWDDLDHEGSVTLPAWMDKYDVGSVYHVHNPAELELLSCLIRYYREFYDTKDIVLEEGEPYTVYPDLEGLRYYGFGEQVTVSLPAGSEWDFWTRDIQFHHVHFAGPCADFFRKERASRKEQAQAAQEQGRKKDAMALYTQCAAMGDGEAAYRLGLLWKEQQDTDAAKQWLQEAADAGHREAAWELSRLLTPTESKKAFSYLVKAADAGHGQAAYALGQIFETGRDLEDGEDYGEAGRYYELAEKAGVAAAAEARARCREKRQEPQFREKQYSLYEKYRDSDEDKALGYLREAALLGYDQAQASLIARDLAQAQACLDGQDDAGAVTCLEEAVSYGSPEAMYRLAGLKAAGQGTDQDAAAAERLYFDAARDGFGPACVAVGRLQEGRKQYEEAFSWYEKGAARQIPEAYERLGCCYEKGQGTAQDAGKAILYYRQAVQAGVQTALQPLLPLDLARGAQCYDAGEYGEALTFFEEAGGYGSRDAMLRAADLRGSREYPEGFDYAKAMDWYHAAAAAGEGKESPETRAKREALKGSVSCAVRLAYFVQRYETSLGGDSHYYLGAEAVAKRLDNAMKGYGASLGVPAETVVLLCDASNALFWGKGKKGFLITADGTVYTSRGETISLEQVEAIHFGEERSIRTQDGSVFCHFADSDDSDDEDRFCQAFNEEVLLSAEERAEAGSDGAPEKTAAAPVEMSCAAGREPSVEASEGPEDTEAAGNTASGETTDAGADAAADEAAPAARTDRQEALRAFVRDLAAGLDDSPTYLYCAPRIPEKKLHNVLKSYAKGLGIEADEVLVLCDNTVFGSAKDGFILTAKDIVSSEAGLVPLAEIERVEPSQSMWGGKMLLNPGGKVLAIVPPDKELTSFCEGMNRILQNR